MQDIRSEILLVHKGKSIPFVEIKKVNERDCQSLSSWILDDRVARWMDFGNGKQNISSLQLSMMLMSKRNDARLFNIPYEKEALGITCLMAIDNQMGSSEIWVARNHLNRNKRNPVYQHATASAVIQTLANAFLDYNLKVVSSWAVECNYHSHNLHETVGMRKAGTLRSHHLIGSKRYDRILYDMTYADFGELYPNIVSQAGNTFQKK